MKNILRIFFMVVYFGTTCSWASDSATLSTLLNGIHTLKAEFTQKIYDNRDKVVQQSYGRMALERPGKFRWEVTKPIPQIIVANGMRLWIYDPDLEQVTIRSLQKANSEVPALLLSDSGDIVDKNYNVKAIISNNKAQQWFMLSPKSQDSMFASVKMGFENGQITEMRLQDHLGHTTAIIFKNKIVNSTVAASLFNFTIPKNTDVIDETKKS